MEKESRGRGKNKEERRVKGATDITKHERENRKGTGDKKKKEKTTIDKTGVEEK